MNSLQEDSRDWTYQGQNYSIDMTVILFPLLMLLGKNTFILQKIQNYAFTLQASASMGQCKIHFSTNYLKSL